MCLCLNLNSKNTFSSYKDPIWADAAGYYVYLPATFIYGWEENALPIDWPGQLGGGFEYDEGGKVRTKYPVGVALLELPFFLLAHGWASSNGNANGYSYEYHIGLWAAGLFYLILGLFFLKEFLVKRFDLKYVIVTLLVLLLGTNLYYYGLDAVGMSHIYSFFLFALLLWLSDTITQKVNAKSIVLFAFFAGICLMVRPTSIIYLLFLLVLNSEFLATLRRESLKKPLLFLSMLIAFVLPMLPQFLYWKYSTGNFIHYSYGEEGFNWLGPELFKFWFSTNNGLFVYAPILLFSILGVVILFKENRKQAIQFILFFLVISYVFSSWWSWYYGCSYGSRNFVEYLVPLSIPFCLFVQRTFTSRFTSVKYFLFGVAVFFIFINLKIIYKYDYCFYGDTSVLWDWSAYYKLIF
jgi:hypothetical protein